MTALDLQPGKAVFILWEDSATIDGWQFGPKPDPGIIATVGWLVSSNEQALVVSSSLNDEFSCICPLSIPWSCVTQCEELEPQWNEPFAPKEAQEFLPSPPPPFVIMQEDRELTEEYEALCQQLQKD